MKTVNFTMDKYGIISKFGFRGFPGMIKALWKVNNSCKKLGYKTRICIDFPITRNRKKYEGEATLKFLETYKHKEYGVKVEVKNGKGNFSNFGGDK